MDLFQLSYIGKNSYWTIKWVVLYAEVFHWQSLSLDIIVCLTIQYSTRDQQFYQSVHISPQLLETVQFKDRKVFRSLTLPEHSCGWLWIKYTEDTNILQIYAYFLWSRRYLHLIKCVPAESCSVQPVCNVCETKVKASFLCCTTPRRPNACHACSYEANLTEFPKNSKEAILNQRCSCSIWPFNFQIKSYFLTWNHVVSKRGVINDRNE